MYGISIYLNEDVTEEVKQYIRRMHEIGLKVFSRQFIFLKMILDCI